MCAVVEPELERDVTVFAHIKNSQIIVAQLLVQHVESMHVGGFMKVGHHHFVHGHVGDRDVFARFNRAPGFDVLDRFENERVLSRACTAHKRRS